MAEMFLACSGLSSIGQVYVYQGLLPDSAGDEDFNSAYNTILGIRGYDVTSTLTL